MSHRLRVEAGTLERGRRSVTGDDYRYLFRALRLAVGDRLELFDGAGFRADAGIVAIAPTRAELEVGEPAAVPASPLELEVIVALIKGERMDWCVQKLTELGVSSIVPVTAARSVVRVSGDRAAKRRARLEAIASDAARQCGRATVPEIAAIGGLAEAVTRCSAEIRLVLDESDRGTGLRDSLLPAAARTPPITAALLVGPEGGFEPAEIATARQASFESVGLGPRILRAETAAIAAAAAVQFVLGDLGQAI